MFNFSLVISFLALASAWVPTPAIADTLAEVRVLAAEERFDAAVEKLGVLLDKSPDDVEAQLLLGVVLTRQGQSAEAIDAFRRLAAKHPELSEVHNNLAVLYAAANRFEEARSALLKAIELEPRYGVAQENLGDVYAKLASLAYQRAFELDQKNSRVREKSDLLAQAFQVAASTSARARSRESAPAVVASTRETTAPTAKPSDGSIRCWSVGGFDSEAAMAPDLAWLENRGMATRAKSRDEQRVLNYKVYLPPFESRADTRAQMAKLSSAGLRDLITISRGDLKNGIMLGVYSQPEAVERRIAELRALGYTANAAPRYGRQLAYWIEVRESAGGPVDAAAVKEKFSNRDLHAIACD